MRARAIINILLWALLCFLLAAATNGVRAVLSYPVASLRFKEPIGGQSAYNTRLYSIAQGDTFWPTFYREGKLTLENEIKTLEADCIEYSGDAHLVWPAHYIEGTAPGVTDELGAAISSALAWRLWGSIDIVGKKVTADGMERTIRGVFEDSRELALLSYANENTEQSWNAVMLSGGGANSTRDNTVSYALAVGLGMPDYILMTSGILRLVLFLSALPLLPLFVRGLCLIAAFITTLSTSKRKASLIIIFTVITLSLFVLPLLLPTWLVPTYWSDFGFWPQLIGRGYSGIVEFLSMPPTLRDVELKLLLLKQVGLSFAGVATALVIAFHGFSLHPHCEQTPPTASL